MPRQSGSSSRRDTLRGVIFAVLVASACGDDVSVTAPPKADKVRGVTVSPSRATVKVGETVVLAASVDADSGVARSVTWASIDQRRVSVTATGIMTGVSPGVASISATSTADTTKKAFIEVEVVAGKGVRALTVTPTSVSLKAGETQAVSVAVDGDPGISRAVTFVSAAPAIATVSAAGVVTAITPGATTITASSVADPSISVTVGVTVREAKAPLITITSITAVNSQAPVNIINVTGQIEFNLTLEPGDETIDRVEVILNDGVRDTVAAIARFSALQQDVMLNTLVTGQVSAAPITLSVQTAAFTPASGAVAFRNGVQRVRAVVVTKNAAGVETRRASSGVDLIFANLDGFYGTVQPLTSTSIATARDANGLEWVQAGKGLVFRTVPVMYSGRAVGTRIISYPGRAPIAAIVSSKPGISVDTLQVPNYVSPNAGPFYIGGEVAMIAGSDTQGATLQLVGIPGIDGSGFVNAQPVVGVVPRLNGLRVDNVPPPATATFTLSTVLNNSNNWVNGAYQFASGLTGITGDVGVGLAGSNLTPTAASAGATYVASGGALTAPTPVSAGAELPPSNVNSEYTVEARYADRLGNVRAVPLTANASHPLVTFGVDVQAPTVRYLTIAPAGAAAITTGTDSVYSSVTAPSGPLVFGVEALDDRSGFGPTPAAVTLTRFAQPNPAGTFDGTTSCVVGVIVNGNCTPALSALTAVLPDFFRQDTTLLDGGSGIEGYYTYTAVVRDQAGNAGGTRLKRALYDVGAGASAPQLSTVGQPAVLFGGQPAAFLPTATDNVELARGILYVTYPNLPTTTAIAYDGGATTGFSIGVKFDNQLTSPIQGGFGFTVPSFIRGLEITDATDAPQPYPLATAKPNGVNAVLFDFVTPGSPATLPVNTPILAGSVDGPPASPGFAALTGVNAISKWRRFAGATRFDAVGPSGQTVSPFAKVILLQLSTGYGPNAQVWRIVAERTTPVGFDNGLNRIWTYDFASPGAGTYIALGLNATGDAIATQPTTF